ncbi:MAG: DUF6262 family protein [Proteobacteria bacterium]|nr:DUF6262 family protein [Pseudomonadota bacterium]
MNTEKHITALKEAAQTKSMDTLKRFHDALKIMQDEQIPINLESVARFAKVSKRWIYNNPTLVEQIKNIKKERNNNRLMIDQAIQLRAKDREIEILVRQNKTLRMQIDELRHQLEVSYAALYKQND